MLTWNDKIQKDQTGKVLSVSYTASIPHWGEASIHPDVHHPGEMFLTCPELDIKMHLLGKVLTEDIVDSAKDAINPAEAALVLLPRLKIGKRGVEEEIGNSAGMML